MNVDVDVMKAGFLQELVRLVKRRKFGADCIFNDVVKTFYAYLTVLESGCVLDDELWKQITEFYAAHLEPCTPHDDSVTDACNISADVVAQPTYSCRIITLTILK